MSETTLSVERPAPDLAAPSEHFDVIVIGAGLSGIGAAYHLRRRLPNKTFVLLEGRATLGGTWDLFRYPGVRSDSDMHTLGFAFRPWRDRKVIAEGGAILDYLKETAAEHDIERRIRFGHKVIRTDWSSADARWTVEVRREAEGDTVRFTCGFLFTCCGYYDYSGGYTPDFPGRDRFGGEVLHPQAWPDRLEVDGKRVVVIGSGATAMTLVPALTKLGARVTMLQRSPTYVVALPSTDPIADRLRPYMPPRALARLIRWKNILLSIVLFRMARRKPDETKAKIMGAIQKYLGPDYDVQTHFNPTYKPWDQRLCLVPDGDLFRAIRAGQAEIVTDAIEEFTERGVLLRSGRTLDADVVVTATGLRMQLFGGMQVAVDGQAVDFGQTLSYRGVMFSGVPNLVTAFGYTNASWTLKSELTCLYVCRLLRTMDRRGFSSCTPRPDPAIGAEPLLEFSSGYVQRGLGLFPSQGNKRPWRIYQNYLLDLINYRFAPLYDGSLKFSRKA